ncbi:MAG TPA: hypothetical protein VGI23_18955 [Steroidobacteraceae bacterium]
MIKKSPANFITEEQVTPKKTVTVKVIDRWSIVDDDGKRHVEGDELSVPEHLAEEWERNRWVERVSSKS